MESLDWKPLGSGRKPLPLSANPPSHVRINTCKYIDPLTGVDRTDTADTQIDAVHHVFAARN